MKTTEQLEKYLKENGFERNSYSKVWFDANGILISDLNLDGLKSVKALIKLINFKKYGNQRK